MNTLLPTLAILGAKYLYIIIMLIGGIQFFLFSKVKQRQVGMLAIISLPITFIMLEIAGALYYNPRPFVVDHFIPLITHSTSNGFPSDHTILCAAVASIIFYANKKTGTLLWILTFLVGASRVYVGVHHPIDVIASMVIATIVTYACVIFTPNMMKYAWYSKVQAIIEKNGCRVK